MQLLLAVLLVLASPPRSGALMTDAPPLTDLATSKGFLSAEQLKGLCNAPEDRPGGEFDGCLSYLAGAVDQMVARDMIWPRSGRKYCPITNLTLGELREAFVGYIDGHPELGKAAAATIVERATGPVLSCKPLRTPTDM